MNTREIYLGICVHKEEEDGFVALLDCLCCFSEMSIEGVFFSTVLARRILEAKTFIFSRHFLLLNLQLSKEVHICHLEDSSWGGCLIGREAFGDCGRRLWLLVPEDDGWFRHVIVVFSCIDTVV